MTGPIFTVIRERKPWRSPKRRAQGRISAPVCRAIKAVPDLGFMGPPVRFRVPSGKMPTSCPPFTSSTAWSMADISPAPRFTGNTPSILKSRPKALLSNHSALLIKNTCRRGMAWARTMGSFIKRWLQTTRAPPSLGMFSRPSTRMSYKTAQMIRVTHQAKA